MDAVAMAGHNASQWLFQGYKATLGGQNRDDATSGDATVRDEYVRKNGDLSREILRMLPKSEAAEDIDAADPGRV